MKKLLPIIVFIGIIFYFFKPFIVDGLLPIPSDNLIGLYHPYRDLYAKENPRGIAYKNFLISDPIEQQYPWRYLSINIFKQMQFPIWNPYSFSGTPLFANQQSAVLYPLNVLFFIFPFAFSWSTLIFLQPLLGGLFMYLYLRKIKLSQLPSLFGAIIFAFSGFSMVWMEWNTIMQTIIWLPLVLYIKEVLIHKFSVTWAIGLLFAESLAFFAGHLQTWFYLVCITNAYLIFRILETAKMQYPKDSIFVAFIKKYVPFLVVGIIFLLIISIQIIPLFQFISLSARNVDQADWHQIGWFIPWQNLVGFIIPDFFGNPATLNYWGIWNYMEFAIYAGIAPFILMLFSFFSIKSRFVAFFWFILIVGILFAFPTPIAQLPYILHIPFLSTSQPTRLAFVIDFTIAILAAFGLERFLEVKKKIYIPILITTLGLTFCWVIVLFNQKFFQIPLDNLLVTKRNLILPTGIFLASSLLLLLQLIPQIKNRKFILSFIAMLIIAITTIDLIRFNQKFIPFTPQKYLYPQTSSLNFLQKNLHEFRFMTTDRQILPPNTSVMYKIQSVDGYDPLYLQRYGEFVAAMERGKPDINPPFGFNRIITPKNYRSPLVNLLGVKYVVSLSNLSDQNLKKVFIEGETKIYENTNVIPRVFSVTSVIPVNTKQEAINKLFSDINYLQYAVVEGYKNQQTSFGLSTTTIISYKENKVILSVEGNNTSFVVLTDSNYPIWHAYIDNSKTTIYQTDYLFRGVIVPPGRHTITFTSGII
ncbi:MAG TPA: YfhO family protein [Patescibacteria group bacterium]